MSTIDYEDYAYSSEEESQQIKEQEFIDTSAGNPDGLEEDDFENASNNTSDEDEDEDHNVDIDEYASFNTDLEKYQYDQLRWNNISNPRKYTIAKKKGKEEGKAQKKAKARKEDKSQRSTKPEALPKSRRKGKDEASTTSELEVETPKEGEIHFDSSEDLWYSYKKDGIYISERATFHHWIRANLSRDENAKGSYGNYNITCFNAVQQHWGLQRPHYAPVMFEWERFNRADPAYSVGNLYYHDLLVIDYWRAPVQGFREIPLVISSAFEGGYMEPATRLHSEMAYEDIRARMPPFLEVTTKGGTTKTKTLSKASTFSGRSRHFREIAGAISWDRREGSDKIKAYIANIVKPINNSTQGSRNLTKAEVGKMRLRNFGTKPGRSKEGTSKESKIRYQAEIKKGAGLDPTTTSLQNGEGEDNEIQDHEVEDEMPLAEDDGHQKPTDEGGKIYHPDDCDELYEDQKDELIIAGESNAAPPRFVFRCTEAPFLQAMTEEEALGHPLVDVSDPRNHVPKFSNEVDAIRDALKVSVDHFKEIFDAEPIIYEGSNYISEYCNIQDQMDDLLLYDATALRRLGRWDGTIFDWDQATVEEEPCIGRKQPF
ncbi:MAG: hypothetical protein ASARMPREDX12_000046 [Alectoria sarmentosa]|nr:MAG: hypothetical protein ASARMPREDX12_000046 [Alectoria sarmentosa]